MSLINQMLKDLESRRDPATAAHGVIDGMGDSARRTPQRSLFIAMAVIIIALAAAMGYLLWQNLAQSTTANTTHKLNAALASSVLPASGENKTEPAPDHTKAEPPAASPKVQPLVKKEARQGQPEPAADSVQPASPVAGGQSGDTGTTMASAETVDDTADEDEDYSNTQHIEKHIRPMRPAQLAEQHYQAGYTLLQRGDRNGAEERWREALVIDPTHIASREALAGLYLSQSRRVEAAEQLEAGLDYQPGYGQFALLYARLQLENGDNAAAIAILERALQEQAQNGDFYAFLAAIYQRQGAYRKSIAAYQRALQQQPRQSVWWMGTGISLERADKKDEALTAYREARKTGQLSAKLLEYVEGRIQALQ